MKPLWAIPHLLIAIPLIAQDYQPLVPCTNLAGTNTITCKIPYMTTYPANWLIDIVPTENNTGATTINVNRLGAIPVQDARQPIAANRLVKGRPQILRCSTTACQLSSTVGAFTCDPFSNACTALGNLSIANMVSAKNLPIPITGPPYNAKCDGVSDDYPAFAAAAIAGVDVLIPAGVCKFSTGFMITHPMVFHGFSSGTSTLSYTGHGTAITWNSGYTRVLALQNVTRMSQV